MILVDTSVWIDHFRKKDDRLSNLLSEGEVCIHPFVIGELACGNLSNRVEIIHLLKALPHAAEATHDEVLNLIDKRHLFGKALGYIDLHLLASSLISSAELWTKDKRLSEVFSELTKN